MKKLTLKTVRISLKIAIIVSVIIGVVFQNFSGLLVSKGIVSFLYYTTQSNIILAITLGILLYYEFKDLVPPKWLITFHHIAICAISLTFIVFALFLGPYIPEKEYFYSVQNLTLHNIVPVLAITHYFISKDLAPAISKPLALVSGISYLIVTYILHFSGVRFGAVEFPYFFFYYKELGWLRIADGKMGVLYWWIIIALLLYGISVFYYKMKQKTLLNTRNALYIFIPLLTLSISFTLINIIM